MKVTVTLDQGNSSTKLVAFGADNREAATAVLRGHDTVEQLRRALEGLDVTAAIGCTVSAGNVDELLRATDAPQVMRLTSSTPVPLTNLYDTPQTLGTDRLAAAVGARALLPEGELLVADIGTACTFDVVTAANEYLGGNISPGPGMRLRALNNFTANLPPVSGHAERIPDIGRNTVDALRAGALRGVVAEVLYYSHATRNRRRIVLSGGWAPEIAALLPAGVDCVTAPHLVNQGLNRILHYNITNSK